MSLEIIGVLYGATVTLSAIPLLHWLLRGSASQDCDDDRVATKVMNEFWRVCSEEQLRILADKKGNMQGYLLKWGCPVGIDDRRLVFEDTEKPYQYMLGLVKESASKVPTTAEFASGIRKGVTLIAVPAIARMKRIRKWTRVRWGSVILIILATGVLLVNIPYISNQISSALSTNPNQIDNYGTASLILMVILSLSILIVSLGPDKRLEDTSDVRV